MSNQRMFRQGHSFFVGFCMMKFIEVLFIVIIMIGKEVKTCAVLY